MPRTRWQARATRARLVVIGLAAAAVAVAVADRFDASSPTPTGVRVDFVYSSDLDELLEPLIRRFNESGARVRERSIRVEGRALTSGEAERQIAAGELRPVVWAPASSLWGRLLNARVRKDWVPLDNPSIVHSPQVIAMPEQTARRLGWPEQPIGWKDIPALVASGTLRFGHPSPLTSTSGLSALAAEYYAVTGKLAGLTIADVDRARAAVRRIEESVVHYSPTADDFLDQLARYGPRYAAAVVVQETSLVQFNEDSPWRLVAVYPADGTFVADYPYIVVHGPWVDDDEREAAQTFWEWLRGEVTPETAARSGYRVTRPGEPVLPPVDAEHGADPSKPDVLLRPPPPDVLTAILATWRTNRKPADIVLAVDASRSLAGQAPGELARAVDRFLAPLARRQRVGLVTFGDEVETTAPLAPVAANARGIRRGVAALSPAGASPLYDAIAAAVDQAAARGGATRTTAVVVVTAGRDESSSQTLEELLAGIRTSGVRVFAVAYGPDADRVALERIAATSQAQAFAAARGELAEVLGDIALFF